MLQELSATKGDHMLDAGCVLGVHSIRAARHGCTVTGIDLSTTMLSRARRRAKAAGIADEDITLRQADLTRPDLGTAFDHVFAWGVITHSPDTEAALFRPPVARPRWVSTA